MDTPTKIYLDELKELSVEITFLNANHCPGNIFFLIFFLNGYYLIAVALKKSKKL